MDPKRGQTTKAGPATVDPAFLFAPIGLGEGVFSNRRCSAGRTYAKGLSTKKTGSIRSYRYLSRGASGRRIMGETKGRTTAKT